MYLETWHADIESFLELRDNTGEEASRTHNLNLPTGSVICSCAASRRTRDFSLFDPKGGAEPADLYGEEFDRAYEQAERQGLAEKTVKAARSVRAYDAHLGSNRQRFG